MRRLLTLTALVPLALAVWAHAADQTILGKQIQIKDAKPGVDPTKRKIIGQGKETASANTIVGDPTVGGASLFFFTAGATSGNQAFVLPTGIDPASGKPFWGAVRIDGLQVQGQGRDQRPGQDRSDQARAAARSRSRRCCSGRTARSRSCRRTRAARPAWPSGSPAATPTGAPRCRQHDQEQRREDVPAEGRGQRGTLPAAAHLRQRLHRPGRTSSATARARRAAAAPSASADCTCPCDFLDRG